MCGFDCHFSAISKSNMLMGEHEKTVKRISVPGKVSNQPGHPTSQSTVNTWQLLHRLSKFCWH